VDYYKYVKLTNGENIIVMTDTDCKEFKDRKSISIFNPVELSTVRMTNGPVLMESTTLQPWIKIATDDVIELPTESIVVIVDIKEDAIEQYKIFLEEYSNPKEEELMSEEMEEPSPELLERLMNEINQESDFEPEYTNEQKRRAKRTIH
jgi:hypothetical protein